MGGGCSRPSDVSSAIRHQLAHVPQHQLNLLFPNVLDDGWMRFPAISEGLECYVAIKPNAIVMEDSSHKEVNSAAIGDVIKVERNVDDHLQLAVYFSADAGVQSPWNFAFQSGAQRQRCFEAINEYIPKPKPSERHDAFEIFITTWNIGNMRPPDYLADWLPVDDNVMIYAIGLQECDFVHKSIYGSVEDEVVAVLAQHFGEEFGELATVSLWKLRLILFARRSVLARITNVQTHAVGLSSASQGRGAVAVSFHVDSTPLCFINAYFSSAAHQVETRNEEFSKVVQELELNLKDVDCLNQFHHLFWFGDLSYRIVAESRDVAMQMIEHHEYDALYHNDQLRNQMQSGAAFLGFQEGLPAFRPTAPLVRSQTGEYQPGKAPSWYDRVLWKSLHPFGATLLSYDCVPQMTMSDHFPVVARFEIDVLLHPPRYDESSPPLAVEILELSVKNIGAASSTHSASPYCVMFGSFLENLPRIQRTTPQRRTLNAHWTNLPRDPTDAAELAQLAKAPQIPALLSILNNIEYLENEHVLIAVWDDDMDARPDAIGFAAVSLAGAGTGKFIDFSVPLTSLGRAAGIVEGKLSIRSIE